MAKLITSHDPFHIHKVLGVLVLVNFLYRFVYCALFRGYVFCTIHHVADGLCAPEQTHIDAWTIALHGLLSWSSLLLPLPKKRNFNSPMIWTEFRLHSITFATRAVLASLLGLYGFWPDNLALNFLAKLALILSTSYIADTITAKYGCKEKRTTNAMPYPDCITPEMQQKIKYNYAMKQFAAALACISEEATIPWVTLLAIQGAPLMMTLVRKGKVTALTFHRAYILQLAAPMYILLLGSYWNKFWVASEAIQTTHYRIFVVAALHFLTTAIRIDYRQSKFVTWTVSTALLLLMTKEPHVWHLIKFIHTNKWAHAFLTFRQVVDGHYILRNYVPIFTLADKVAEDLDDVIEEFVFGLINGKWSIHVNKVVNGRSDDLKWAARPRKLAKQGNGKGDFHH